MFKGMLEAFGTWGTDMTLGGAPIGTLTRLCGGSNDVRKRDELERPLVELSGTETDCAQ